MKQVFVLASIILVLALSGCVSNDNLVKVQDEYNQAITQFHIFYSLNDQNRFPEAQQALDEVVTHLEKEKTYLEMARQNKEDSTLISDFKALTTVQEKKVTLLRKALSLSSKTKLEKNDLDELKGLVQDLKQTIQQSLVQYPDLDTKYNLNSAQSIREFDLMIQNIELQKQTIQQPCPSQPDGTCSIHAYPVVILHSGDCGCVCDEGYHINEKKECVENTFTPQSNVPTQNVNSFDWSITYPKGINCNQLVQKLSSSQLVLVSNEESANSENCKFLVPNYCNKITPTDLEVRKAASEATRQHAGSYSLIQLLDIYDWVKQNINYLNVPFDMAAPYSPNETLYTKSGDCKNQALLIASMVESIGGTARIVVVPSCQHAYAEVFFGGLEQGNTINQIIAQHYNQYQNKKILWQGSSDGLWLIFDTAGSNFVGETIDVCMNQTATKLYIYKCN